MKITLNGVLTELTADEIISALLADEANGLWKLKKVLDKLEAIESSYTVKKSHIIEII